MRTITKAQLAEAESSGAKVSRKMGTGKPRKAPTPKPATVPMASMKASQQALDAQSNALVTVIAKNTAVIKEFQEELSSKIAESGKKVPYEFTIQRGKDKLIERIVAKPMK